MILNVYDPSSDDYLDSIEEEYKYYIWEEQEYMENRLFYESDLEELEELPKREKQNHKIKRQPS